MRRYFLPHRPASYGVMACTMYMQARTPILFLPCHPPSLPRYVRWACSIYGMICPFLSLKWSASQSVSQSINQSSCHRCPNNRRLKLILPGSPALRGHNKRSPPAYTSRSTPSSSGLRHDMESKTSGHESSQSEGTNRRIKAPSCYSIITI